MLTAKHLIDRGKDSAYKKRTRLCAHERIEHLMRKTTVKNDELLARLVEWEAERPNKPYYAAPRFRSAHDIGMFFGAFYPFASLGLLVGMFVWLTHSRDSHPSVLVITAPIWVTFAFGIGIPIVLGILIDIVNWIIYKARLPVWREYTNKLAAWRARGQEIYAESKPSSRDWEIWQRFQGY